MDFNQVAYCVTVPLLVLMVGLLRNPAGRVAVNLLAVSNLLLIGHSVFLVRQMIGFYYLAKQFNALPQGPAPPIDFAGVRLMALIILPFFSLIAPVRRNALYSVVLLCLLYGHHPFFTWNCFDLFTRSAVYFSLFCSVYALFWLLKKLPYQSV